MLKEGGNFLTKLFKGKYTQRIVRIFLQCFDKVTITKPKACRNASFESFVMCEGFKLSNDVIKALRYNELNESDIIKLNSICLSDNDSEFNYEDSNVKCVQVGDDEYDSDRTYDLDCTGYDKILNPVQMPIDPPYKYYIDNLKGKNI
jgi:tRNA (cytidine32/guanosine34-2'-O)-methyltransferase